MIEAEPAALAAGHDERRHLAAPQRVLAGRAHGSVVRRVRRHDVKRLDPRGIRHLVGMLALRVQLGETFQIDGLQLLEQSATLGLVQSVPAGQDVFLSRSVATAAANRRALSRRGRP